MLISEGVEFQFRGALAQMYVLRNDGYCWGRIIAADGTQLDVDSPVDHYDDNDTDAAEDFIERVHKCPTAVSPAVRPL